jgi:hypothetical protein
MIAREIPKSTLLILAFSLFCSGFQVLSAQNLVQNPSFEEIVKCPKDFGSFEQDVLYWTCPTEGSTDYFNGCSTKMDINRNFAGVQEPFEGDAYAGFYAYGPKEYREYLGGELSERMVKGKKYIISTRISLSEKSTYGIGEFGFLFSDKAISLKTTRSIDYDVMVQNMFEHQIPNTMRIRINGWK